MQATQLLDVARALFQKAVDQFRQGNYRQAIDSFNQVLHLSPEDADVYGHRCVARHRLGDLAGAIADCQGAATLYLEQGNIKDYQYALKMLEKLQR